MARDGLPSMTALLALLAVAGYQNREKIAEMLKGAGQNPAAGGTAPQGGQVTQAGGQEGGLGGLLGGLLGGGAGAGGTAAGAGAGAGGLGGGLGGALGGLLGGAGAGTLINGGLGELLDQFKQKGLGDKAESWVQSGPNKPVSNDELRTAIGGDVLNQLSQTTGLSHDELLARLSQALPDAVDKYTPQGRLPAA
jgi:uncharacterized protein YidB (DUF937 family)